MKFKFTSLLALSLFPALLLSASDGQQAASNNRPNTLGTRALSQREQQVATAAEGMRSQLIERRRDFHMHPELSNREERTARVVAERLRAGP